MNLLDLPTELLSLLPEFLQSIENFTNASSSCRTLRNAFQKTPPSIILRLAHESSRVFFRPSPHFLIAATACQVSQWALQSPDNTNTLRNALRGGTDALLELCISKAGLTMNEIRRLHASRFSIINPLTDMIDTCAGVQWYSTPDFWDGGVSDAETIDVEPQRALFQIIIYGELFAADMDAALEPTLALPRLGLDLRLDYIKYCIPDWVCWCGYDGMKPLSVGPYASSNPGSTPELNGDQIGLRHILNCRTWREAWESVRSQIGPDFDEEWRQQMWHSAVQMQGLNGLEMLRPGGLEKWRGKLHEIRRKLEELGPNDRPAVQEFGRRRNPASDSPYMADEVFVCMAGYWQR